MSSTNENDTSNSSDNVQTTPTSMTTTSLSPTWPPPKAPLPPHRLAKLANALGVSTPIPVHHRKDRGDRSPSPYLAAPSPVFSAPSLSTPDAYASIRETYASLRRSPTPSSAGSVINSGTPYTNVSKYLLHVVPPLYLPHDSQLRDNVTSGSGYHSYFRRGVLVPVHPTLQSQLWAIAKEYALPSTAGLILYLVNPSPKDQITPTAMEGDDELDEPGPRLSEEVWKHLWTRVWKAEREELPPVMPPLGLPGPVSSSPGVANFATRSTPFLPNESPSPLSPLKPFISNAGNNSLDTVFGQTASLSSPSTPSSASTLAFTSKSSRSRSPVSEGPETDTPPTSHSNSLDSTDPDHNFLRANSLPLPGLNSASLMPILAKVEFDIDRKKAGWYEPWAKRRRVKNGKKGKKGNSEQPVTDLPKRLKLSGRAQTASPVSLFSPKDQAASEGYEKLSDSEYDEEEDEDIGDEDETARVLSTSGPDLLHDVFGTDADTWADIKDSRPQIQNDYDLALTGDELVDDEDQFEDDSNEQSDLTRGVEEISEIMAQMGKPQLAVDVSSVSHSNSRKRVPPPLVLHPAGGAASTELSIPSPLNSANSLNGQPGSSSSESTSLPYLKGVPAGDGVLAGAQYEDDMDISNISELAANELDEEYAKQKSPHDTEKRTGGVYDDLDLDLGEIDENDPNDRRKSQIILKAKLDEIERNLAQLSPRALKIDLEDEQTSSVRLSSPRSPFLGIPSNGGTLMNSDVLPPTPTQESGTSPASPPRAQWPAVPYSSLTEEVEETPASLKPSHAESPSFSPPQLAINGVSTFAPKAFKRQDSLSSSSSGISAETLRRRKEAEEEQLYYPALNARSNSATGSNSSSPVIPLSPDPFGRFSSTPEPPEASRQHVKLWDSVPVGGSVEHLIQNSKRKQSISTSIKETAPRTSEASSRFSADSTKDNIEILGSLAKSSSGSSGGTKDSSVKDKDKSANRTTVMSMKGIKKLWRKSNKNSVSANGPPTPVPESPMLPSFLSEESKSLNPPPTPSLSSSRAPSPESLQNLPQTPIVPARPTRPSTEELYIPDIPDQLALPLQPANGRPAPMPIIAAQMQAGLHSRSTPGDRMHFDQESPYPMPTRRPQQRKMSVSSVSSSAQSSGRTPSLANSAGGSIGTAAAASMTSENRQANVRKSILKWKAAAAAQQNAEQTDSASHPSRPSIDRASSSGVARPRASTLSSGSRPSSTNVTEIPPSPKIPDHFLSRPPSEHPRMGSHLTTSSTDSRLTTATDISSFQSLNSPSSSQTSHGSPPLKLQTDLTRNSSLDSSAKLSMESLDHRKKSFDSQSASDFDDGDSDARPSIDSSQFEIVSPKMKVGTLSYPYTTVGLQGEV
ncbi:hypothetical protein GYMLUDRAFT_32553 [Collybiopsis luxurians FD-317 M1]|nr:hypothetical protein GYMLUDRAFT_32553 [Collybiopsis luxurians FD-317 M1]